MGTGSNGDPGRSESRARRLGRSLLAPLIGWALRALAASWRVESLGDDPFAMPVRPVILGALWHEDVLLSASVFRDTGVRVPVSRSRDGSNIAAVMRHLGLGEPPRGSSSRGGSAALRGVVRAVQQTGIVAMLIDGPRGPAKCAKVGIVAASRLSGQPILPVVLEARPCLRFRSWDRTKLPLPFARVVIGWGELLPVDRGASDEEQEAICETLGRRLQRLGEAARARLERRA